jgi:hypothetical protein
MHGNLLDSDFCLSLNSSLIHGGISLVLSVRFQYPLFVVSVYIVLGDLLSLSDEALAQLYAVGYPEDFF